MPRHSPVILLFAIALVFAQMASARHMVGHLHQPAVGSAHGLETAHAHNHEHKGKFTEGEDESDHCLIYHLHGSNHAALYTSALALLPATVARERSQLSVPFVAVEFAIFTTIIAPPIIS